MTKPPTIKSQSRDNRDKRVELLQRYARKHFPATRHLDYAIAVEAVTLAKAANLVGVEGCGFGGSL